MGHVHLSHKNVETLSVAMKAKGLTNYGDFLSDAINYPKGTFTEVGSPSCDGQGVVVQISWELWREQDLLAIAKRSMHETVFQMVETLLTR